MSTQPISSVTYECGGDTFHIIVGSNGITRIEAYEEPGEYCMIPYLRAWRGDEKVAELCKHKAHVVYFDTAPEGAE